MDTAQLSFRLPLELYERLREAAFEDRTRMNRIMIEAVSRYLDERDKKRNQP